MVWSAAATAGTSPLVVHEVVPQIIPAAPTQTLSVTYPSGVVVDGGNELTPTQVKDTPQLSWPCEPDALYTVVFADADAPSRKDPKLRSWRHWLVVNIPRTNLAAGDEVSEFVGSGPPQGTGLHRYVFLVYKQPGNITVDESLRKTKNQATGRGKWDVQEFVQKYNLGTPVAGNLYQAQYDDYVPQVHKQFTD